MNLKPFSSFFGLRRNAVLGCALLACFAGRASAVTITATSAVVNPDTSVLNGTFTEFNPAFATFNFSSTLGGYQVDSLGLLNLSVRISGLQTNNGQLNNVGGVSQIHLTLGGFDTGIALTGFGTAPVTQTFTDVAITQNASAIIALLNDTVNNPNRSLVAGLLDLNGPSNLSVDYGQGTGDSAYFNFLNTSMQMSFSSMDATAVPFTPVETLGYGLIALVLGFRALRRREFMNFAWARFAR